MDLLMVVAATVASTAVALAAEGPPRVILGIALVIFLPGYSLTAALYPTRDSLGASERLALSLGTSIVLAPLLLLALNHTPWGVRLVPVLATLGGFTLAMCLIAAMRRSRLYPPARFDIGLRPPRPSCRGTPLSLHALSVLRLACVVLALGVLGYVTTTPKQAEAFTEFYILAADGGASDYPVMLQQDETATIILGIVNHEGQPTTYTVSAHLDGDPSAVTLEPDGGTALQPNPHAFVTDPIASGDRWEHQVDVTAHTSGGRMKLELLLFSQRPRDDYSLYAAMSGGGDVVLHLSESDGRVRITAHAGEDTTHHCHIEAWQDHILVAAGDFHLRPNGRYASTFRYPPGQTSFRLYDNGTNVLDDTGAMLSLHLWVAVD